MWGRLYPYSQDVASILDFTGLCGMRFQAQHLAEHSWDFKSASLAYKAAMPTRCVCQAAQPMQA